MKKPLIATLALLCCFYTYAQIVFEKGYYIDKADQKIECLIKNIDWKNNPVEFEYKLTENSELKTTTIKSVKEFAIYEASKYKRFAVNIDRSSENMNRLSTTRQAQFNREELFLKVLVEGKASLYFYEDGNLKRFFYNTDSTDVEQLVFKSYKTTENKFGQNEDYKQQLLVNLTCQDIAKSYIENIDYKINDLVKFFIKYNECNNSNFENFEKKQKKDLFNLNIKAGLNNSSLEIARNTFYNSRNINFGNQLTLQIGIEAEFIMPFNKNKWAFIIEPNYQYYNVTKEGAYDIGTLARDVTVDYKSIGLPLGIRHYFYLNDDSKLFINAFYVIDFAINSKIDLNTIDDINIHKNTGTAIGLGYKYNDKYSLEARYELSRGIIDNASWSSDYSSLSLIFGYTLF